MSELRKKPSPCGSGSSAEDKEDYSAITTDRVIPTQLSEGEDVLTRAVDGDQPVKPKKRLGSSIKEPGSAVQIVVAAAIALGIGLGVGSTQDVPSAAITILAIPGNLWLRALTCTVLPLIVVSMVLAVQRLKELSKTGPKLARWTVIYYVSTTLLAIAHSTLLTGLIWRKLFVEADPDALLVSEADQKMVAEREAVKLESVVVDMFNSFVPRNIVDALATNALLAVLIASIIVGYLLKRDSILVRIAKEVETLITVIITFLIKIAPIGVFFLILPNIMRLNIEEVGENIGLLIGGALCNFAIHIFVVMPLIFFLFVRKNPYAYWFKSSKAWITAWGTASSAATMPVTIRESLARGNPELVSKFVIPLGTLVNMDGTAIYFPLVVTFLAKTQGITLNAANYVILILLSTLASIGTTPIPSASLVLVVMICTSLSVPITGMYGLVTAIDWFLDRFRTALNVSGDLYGAAVVSAITKIVDEPGTVDGQDKTETEHEEQMVAEGRATLRREKDVQSPV